MKPQTVDRRSWEEHVFNPFVVHGMSKADVPGSGGGALGWLSLLVAASERPATVGGWHLLAKDSAVPKRSARDLYDQFGRQGHGWSGAVGFVCARFQ